jgi:hypothetical protein
MKYVLSWIVNLPMNLLGVLGVLLIRPIWGRELSVDSGTVIVDLHPESWPMRTWYRGWAGTTFLGHAVMLGSQNIETLDHELVHVRQFAHAGFIGLVVFLLLSLLGWWWVGLIFWTLSPALYYVGAMLLAVSEGGHGYTDNVLEQAARGMVDRP